LKNYSRKDFFQVFIPPLYLSDGGRNFPGYILKKVNFYSPALTNIYTPSTTMTVTTTTATIEQTQEDSVSLTGANAIKLFSLSFSNKLECLLLAGSYS
jgi:hypothetical protein